MQRQDNGTFIWQDGDIITEDMMNSLLLNDNVVILEPDYDPEFGIPSLKCFYRNAYHSNISYDDLLEILTFFPIIFLKQNIISPSARINKDYLFLYLTSLYTQGQQDEKKYIAKFEAKGEIRYYQANSATEKLESGDK